MQVWETLYRHMFNLYVSHTPPDEDLLAGVKARLIDVQKTVPLTIMCMQRATQRVSAVKFTLVS